MRASSFFSKIISDLKSERETHISHENDTIEISYPAIGKEDLRNNWYEIPVGLLFSLSCFIGLIATLTGILPSFSEISHETTPEEKFALLYILFLTFMEIAIPVWVYRKVIRPLFITEKLTLHPSYFVYSLGTRRTFKEVVRIKKEDLISFAVRGNPSRILRFISTGSEGKNHLYVYYDKKKKKEIMGGRSDDEHRKITDILESYRTSADIYEKAKAFNEREKQEKTEQIMPKSEKREGRIRKLLGPEPLEEKDCLKTNGVIGLLMLPSIVFFLMGDKNDFPFPPEFVYISITAGIVLAGGYLLAACNSSLTRNILVLQGAVICLIVFVYTFFMWYVAQMMISGEKKGGMGHAPGILAYGAAYGIKQVINFSGLSSDSGIAQRLPAIFFVIGACCDIFVVYLIYKCFSSWKPSW